MPTFSVSTRPVGGIRDVCAAINAGRTTVYDRMKTDPDFPKPFMIGGKITFFMDEIELYKETRPRRQYADTAA